MKILVHDFAGHPFQIGLSRWLAGQGHTVHHVYSNEYETPRGDLSDGIDIGELTITGIGRGKHFPKYNIARRYLHESDYGRLAATVVRHFRPDVVLSGNTPPVIQSAILNATRQVNGRFVYWAQDIFSFVFDRMVSKRVPIVGPLLGRQFRRMEFGLMKRSDAVVVISEDFIPICAEGGVDRDAIVTIRNWAPLGEITLAPRENSWAIENGLAGKFVFLFSGTMGMKHNPGLISGLAESLRDRDDAVVVVISQGAGHQWLQEQVDAKGLTNLKLLGFQPFSELSNVFGSADVLIAILESFAGELSVPSKVLSYLCAGRPLLGALPQNNLAARIIREANAGIVVPSSDEQAFIRAARALMNDPVRCKACGAGARAYAEQNFDIDRIGARFLALFEKIGASSAGGIGNA